MSFFPTDMMNKSENERKAGVVAAINQQIEYLRQKIAYERELALNEAIIPDCERKILSLEDLVTKLNNPAFICQDMRTALRRVAISHMDFDSHSESYTCQVLIYLAEEKYDVVDAIFDHQQKGCAHDAQSRLVLKNIPLATPETQNHNAFWKTPPTKMQRKGNTDNLQKVEDTKAAIDHYIKLLNKELYDHRFNPFVGYIAKSKVKLLSSLAEKIKESYSWQDVRDEVLSTYLNNQKKFHSGYNKQHRAVTLVTNILKDRPKLGTDCGNDVLTPEDLSFSF